MYERPVYESDWFNKPPKTNTILPGVGYSWKVRPYEIWGERVWKGVPEPSDSQKITLTAVFETAPSAAATKYGVWTGRVTSAPIAARVVDQKLTTPHRCLEEDCPKLAIKMMEADPKWIQRVDGDEQTPLHVAAYYGHADVVRWLLSKGAAVNAGAYNQFTPLHLAATPEIAKLLIDHKADVNAGSPVGRTILQDAALQYAPLGEYPEFAAEREEKRAIIKLLLDAGATYDIRSACCMGHVERVRILLQDKEEVRDKEAMRLAVMYGQAAIVKLFLDHGADREDADYGGLTLSFFALKHPSVLKLLLDAGADPKIKLDYQGSGVGPKGSTLLHEAAEAGAVDSAKILIERGVDVNAKQAYKGIVPLHLAAWKGSIDFVRLLLSHGADINTKDNDGKDAIDWANLGSASPEMIQLLTSHGCRRKQAKK